MPTIGFDISGLDPAFKSHAGRGIGRYIEELHNFFISSASFKNNKNCEVRFFDCKCFALPYPLESAINALPLGKQTIKQQLCYPFQLTTGKMKQFDLLHFAAQTDAPSWCTKPYIMTVHDIIPLVCSDLYSPQENNWRFKLARYLELQSMKKAAHIIVISQSTANDLNQVVGIPHDKMTIIPHGIDERFYNEPTAQSINTIRERFSIKPTDKTLLYVGGIDPHKNMFGLLELFSKVVEHYKQKGVNIPRLLITGKNQKHKNYPALLKRIAELGLVDYVLLTGFVPDAELLALYSICSVFVFPSLYEGFGLPVGEAMAAKIPVVAVSSSSIPEVAGDAALLFNPAEVDKGVSFIIELLENEELRSSMKAKGVLQAKKFTWGKTGVKTLEVYERMVARHPEDISKTQPTSI